MIKISIIMSVFNGAEYVDQAVESILNQTFHDFEFIIVDDGSTDNTIEIIEKYEDSRIRVIRNVNNYGLPKSLNIGIGLSKGLYIARQDADDISEPDRLRKQYEFAVAKNSDLLGSAIYLIDKDGIRIGLVTNSNFYIDYEKPSFPHTNTLFAHGSALMKRKVIEEIGGYNENFIYAQDAELWMRFICERKSVDYLNEPLYYLRRLPITNNRKAIGQRKYMELLRKAYSGLPEHLDYEHEARQISQELKHNRYPTDPYFMSNYWRYCSTTALTTSHNGALAREYIIKAIREKNYWANHVYHHFVLISTYLPEGIMSKLGSSN